MSAEDSDEIEIHRVLTDPRFSKFPSSKARRYSFSSSRPCTLWAKPLGKYHMSPVLSVSVVKAPFSSTLVRRRFHYRQGPIQSRCSVSDIQTKSD